MKCYKTFFGLLMKYLPCFIYPTKSIQFPYRILFNPSILLFILPKGYLQKNFTIVGTEKEEIHDIFYNHPLKLLGELSQVQNPSPPSARTTAPRFHLGLLLLAEVANVHRAKDRAALRLGTP